MPNIGDSSTYSKRDSVGVDSSLKCGFHHSTTAQASICIAKMKWNENDALMKRRRDKSPKIKAMTSIIIIKMIALN